MPRNAAVAVQRSGRPAGRDMDPDEFARRFEDAAGVLWTVATAVLGDPGRAEDALQEACVIALDKLDRFRPGTSFVAWMGAIVRNVARNEARKGRRRATGAVAPDALAELAPEELGRAARCADPAPVDERGELRAGQAAFDDALERALAELRPVQRAALLLRAVRGLDYREISAVLGVPEGTAMSHVHRARGALRRRLAAADPEPRSAAPDGGARGAE